MRVIICLLKYLFAYSLLFALALSAGSKEVFMKFKEYKNHNQLTDFMIIANDGVKYPCHKLILSVASDCFSKMLTSNMSESKNNILHLPYRKDTIEILLAFIYDPDKTTLDKMISLDVYLELKECADIYFINNLQQALTTVKVIIEKDLPETIDYILNYKDINLTKHFFYHSIENDILSKPINVLIGHNDAVNHASFSPDGKLIITASYDNTAKIWDISGKEITTFREHSSWIRYASFSPNGKLIITSSYNNTAKIWDISGKEITTLRGHSSWIRHASFSPDGKLIITASDDRTAKLWDISGKEFATLRGHSNWVHHASFSPDGKLIITASHDKTAKIWDISGKEITTLRGHSNWVHHASFSPDGKLIITTSNDNIAKLWDISGQKITTLRGHNDWVSHASFSHDGKFILTASNDNTAKIWDISGKELTTLRGHSTWVHHASFSPDGKLIITASHDNTAKLWDISGKEITTLRGHNNWVRHASFSLDGNFILTASDDKTVMVWIMPPLEFYDHQLLSSDNKDEAKSWLMLKYLLINYLKSINKDEKPNYQDFISYASSLISDNDLAYIAKFIFTHEHLKLYFTHLFKNYSY